MITFFLFKQEVAWNEIKKKADVFFFHEGVIRRPYAISPIGQILRTVNFIGSAQLTFPKREREREIKFQTSNR